MKTQFLKQSILMLSFLFSVGFTFSQAPEKMSYQSVIRRTNNDLVVNQNVRVKISILQGTISGAAVYVEDHTTSTNSNGLVSLSIGGGNVISGTFSAINWEIGPYFVKMEADPTGGTNYTVSGTSQLMSVPYALYAKTSGSSTPGPQGIQGVQGSQGEIGPQGPAGLLSSGSDAGNTTYWNGTEWVVNNSNIYNSGGSVGVGTTTPSASSKLEVSSTSQGFLMPRMSKTQRDAITSPVIGLLIFQTDNTPGFYYYTGTAWIGLSNSSSSSSGGSDANTLIYTTQGF